jgi:hypothetical protein
MKKVEKLENPFTTQPEENPKFWTAKSKPLKDFKNFFEFEVAQKGASASISVVGDVGSGKTRLFEYLTEKFKLDPTKVVCLVSMNRIFTDLTPEYIRETGASFLKIFHNEIYKQLEKTYESVLKSKETNEKQKEFANHVLQIVRETKRKVIGPRLEHLRGLEEILQKIEEDIRKAPTEAEKKRLEARKRDQEFAISKISREEQFTPDEFYSFLDILLKKLKEELNVEIFILYIDELERIKEMEKYQGIILKSTVESELRDQLIKKFEPKGLKIVVACTRQAWEYFELRFTSSFPPKPIPNLEAEDLEAAIEDHLRKVNQEKFNPFTDKNAIKFIAHYSYSNFRQCMIVLNKCYQDYINNVKEGKSDWTCTLDYVIKERFSDAIRLGFYNDCIRILERQLPRISKKYIEHCLKVLLVHFEEFDYNTLRRKLEHILSSDTDFRTFIDTLRNIGAIDEIKPNVYVVRRENFAILEVRRSELEDKVLRVFHELAAGKNEVERIALRERLKKEGMDDTTIENVLKDLSRDTLQPIGSKIVFIGISPSDLEIMKGYIREAGREPWKLRLENETKMLAPYVLNKIWEFETNKYNHEDNVWKITKFFDPGTAGGIEVKINGVVLFRDYRYEKSAEELLKGDIRYLQRILKKDSKLQFALILCIHDPPLPEVLIRKGVSKDELNEIRRDPMLWRSAKVGGIFNIDGSVLGDENTISHQGNDIIWKETRIYFSDQIFVYPIYGEMQFSPGMKFENEKLIDYILAINKIVNYFGKKIADIEARYLDHAKRDAQNLLINPMQDRLVAELLRKMWQIKVQMGRVEEALWIQYVKKGKWYDNTNIIQILDQIAKNGYIKADENNQKLLNGLITSGFFGYHGKIGKVEEIYLKKEASLSGKGIPIQFEEIYKALSSEPKDAVSIFSTYLYQRAPFQAQEAEEVLRIYPDKFKALNIKGLIGSTDIALYILSKMFADILQEKNEDGRFVYKLLKEVPTDPEKFLQTIDELNNVIKFLQDKGFELEKENEEIENLLEIGQSLKKKLEKSLDLEAKRMLSVDTESKLTNEKLTPVERLDKLHRRIWEVFLDIKAAFVAYPEILMWQKNPYFEKWNQVKQIAEKVNLPPLPEEIKTFLEKNISALIKEEEYPKVKAEKIFEIWETKIWPKMLEKVAEPANPIIKLIRMVNDSMGKMPNLHSFSQEIGKISMKFEDFIRILKPIKNLRQIVLTLKINYGYVKSYNDKMSLYHEKVLELCYELMKMSRAKLGNLTYIVEELLKIDACREEAKEYQKTVRDGRQKFHEKFEYTVVKFSKGEIDEEQIMNKLYELLRDLLLNWSYGTLILYLFESEIKEKMMKTLFDALKQRKFVKLRKDLNNIKKFCEKYDVKFTKEIWEKSEENSIKKYESFIKAYIDGIWQCQTTILIDDQEIQNITQFEQMIDLFNDKIVREIINEIPNRMKEPYNFILYEVRRAYNKWKMEGKKEIFATILNVINEPKIKKYRIRLEQILQFLKEVESFGLLW